MMIQHFLFCEIAMLTVLDSVLLPLLANILMLNLFLHTRGFFVSVFIRLGIFGIFDVFKMLTAGTEDWHSLNFWSCIQSFVTGPILFKTHVKEFKPMPDSPDQAQVGRLPTQMNWIISLFPILGVWLTIIYDGV